MWLQSWLAMISMCGRTHHLSRLASAGCGTHRELSARCLVLLSSAAAFPASEEPLHPFGPNPHSLISMDRCKRQYQMDAVQQKESAHGQTFTPFQPRGGETGAMFHPLEGQGLIGPRRTALVYRPEMDGKVSRISVKSPGSDNRLTRCWPSTVRKVRSVWNESFPAAKEVRQLTGLSHGFLMQHLSRG